MPHVSRSNEKVINKNNVSHTSSSSSGSGSSSGSESSGSSSRSSSDNENKPLNNKSDIPRAPKLKATPEKMVAKKSPSPLSHKPIENKRVNRSVSPAAIKKPRSLEKGSKSKDRKESKVRSGDRHKSKSPRRRKAKSPSPKPTKVHIGHLTRNVTRDHIKEIFSVYGTIRTVEMQPDRNHPEFSKGFAYVEYENAEDMEKAVKHMDGAQIDGQEVSAAAILVPKPPPRRVRRTPPRRAGPRRRPSPQANRPRRSPVRERGRRSPRRVSPVAPAQVRKHKSRSPKRRRYSKSSDSSDK